VQEEAALSASAEQNPEPAEEKQADEEKKAI
jgi:hypothetical protein